MLTERILRQYENKRIKIHTVYGGGLWLEITYHEIKRAVQGVGYESFSVNEMDKNTLYLEPNRIKNAN